MNEQQPKYAVIKTKDFSLFNGEKHLGTTIVNVFFRDKWSGLAPISDDLIKDPVLIEKDGKLKITGKKIHFYSSLGKTTYGKKYELFEEICKSGKKLTTAEVVALVLYRSAQKLKIEESEIKLGYSNFWDWIRRKRTYYLDCSPEIISKMEHLELTAIKKNKNSFFIEGWSQTTIFSDYNVETNNYTISKYN